MLKLDVNPRDFEKYKVKIVNGKPEPFDSKTLMPHEHLAYEHGLPIVIDDYGMGAIHWSLVESETDVPARVMEDNKNWAKARLPWARKNAPKEVPELERVMKTGER